MPGILRRDIDRAKSGEIDRKILAEPEIFNLDQFGVLCHLLLHRQVYQLLHHLLLPLSLASIAL